MVTRLMVVGAAFAACLAWTTGLAAADVRSGLKQGTPDVKSAGPIAFAPQGILLLGDPQSAALFAIDTLDAAARGGRAARRTFNVQGIDARIAAALGTQPQEILINDLAVNPASGLVYLSVSRGRGPGAQPVLLRVQPTGALEEVPLRNVRFARAELPNPPADQGSGRQQSQRRESITDLAYVDGRVIVAGLSNEEFASKLRSIPLPFEDTSGGASVEIFHGSHGRFETRSPVRTFVPYDIGGDLHLLAAYTCTPLVKFAVKDLQPGRKVQGTTIAELGNRNRPLDMIVYQKSGQDFILMANSSRGLMKISTKGIGEIQAIEQRVPDVAGLSYETIQGMEGVEQLDRLGDAQAVILVRQADGRMDLATIDLP